MNVDIIEGSLKLESEMVLIKNHKSRDSLNKVKPEHDSSPTSG